MDEATLARFMAKVRILANGCWYWTGAVNKDGYAQFRINGATRSAHRVSYEHFTGPIPDGLELDHLCHTRDTACPGGKGDRHRRCVSPQCLEPATHQQNSVRGRGFCAVNAAKTHCDKGHALAAGNLYIGPDGGRECKKCRKARGQAWELAQYPDRHHYGGSHCENGHEYTDSNTITTASGHRRCRECKNDWSREYMRRRRAAAKAARQERT